MINQLSSPCDRWRGKKKNKNNYGNIRRAKRKI